MSGQARSGRISFLRSAAYSEEISVGKRVKEETRHVTDTVRHEEAVVEHDDGVEVEHRQAGLPHGEVQ